MARQTEIQFVAAVVVGAAVLATGAAAGAFDPYRGSPVAVLLGAGMAAVVAAFAVGIRARRQAPAAASPAGAIRTADLKDDVLAMTIALLSIIDRDREHGERAYEDQRDIVIDELERRAALRGLDLPQMKPDALLLLSRALDDGQVSTADASVVRAARLVAILDMTAIFGLPVTDGLFDVAGAIVGQDLFRQRYEISPPAAAAAAASSSPHP